MLHFLRKHQRYFFVAITVVIVISFSFFGTYSAMNQQVVEDPVAFTTVTGKKVKRSDLEALTHFISTDNEDKFIFGGMAGPNFLNDGVVKRDFLETGLAALLAAEYAPQIKDDWQQRLEREKKYTLYKHPEAQFISAETAWDSFLPGKKTHFYKLQQAEDALAPDAINARVNLFLDERNFPAPTLRQILAYQEHQFSFVKHDPQLDRNDLFLFGHYTMEDWFGPRFLRVVAQFIINSAKVAEERGYRVSDAEAFAELSKNAELSFNQLSGKVDLGAANSGEYLSDQLRKSGMDRSSAVKIWKDVMLFRRLFNDMGDSVLLAPFAFEKFNQYANESVSGDLYNLPAALRIGNFKELQKLETYLSAVAKNKKEDPLSLPTLFQSPAELMKTTPELVQKHYLLEIAEVDKKDLQGKISLKEMWQWQVSDENWAALTKEFADLGVKKAETQEERFTALDQLDSRTKMRVDTFSRGKMVSAHPEWISQALDKAEPKQMNIGLSSKGGSSPIKGLENREELIRLLDLAPLKEQSPKLAAFSPDGMNFYRIAVLERSPNQEILSFAEANREGILDSLVEKQLQSEYDAHKEQYQKPLADVKELVAEQVYGNILQAIRKDAEGKVPASQLSNDLTASLRFYNYMRSSKERLKNFPDSEKSLVAVENETNTLKDQWKLEKKAFITMRKNTGDPLNKEEIFTLKEKSWSDVNTLPNGEVFFLFAKEKGVDSPMPKAEQIAGSHELLSDEAMQMLAKQLLASFKEKNAISLSYMDKLSS